MEGTTKPIGGYRYLPFTVTLYLVLAKYNVFIQNCKQTYNVDFPPVYGTLNEHQL